MLGDLFMDSVEQAVGLSVKQERVLVVYNTSGDDRWLESWFAKESLGKIKPFAVWLRLVKGTEQFDYFEEIFGTVALPSLYLVKQGKVLSIIKDEDNKASAGISHWESLAVSLGASLSVHADIAHNTKTLREQVEETTQQKYQDELIKQRKIELEERERILRLVEADKVERKARKHPAVAKAVKSAEIHDYIKDSSKLRGEQCTLLIRLTNGNTITKQFNSSDTLNDARKWVDLNRTDGDGPYSFHRNIPRSTFTDSDELKSLAALELLPRSALFILKPIDTELEHMNVVSARGPGLLGKVFGGISAWWNNGNSKEAGRWENANDHNHNEEPSSQRLLESTLDHQTDRNSRGPSLQINNSSGTPSRQTSPAQVVNDRQIKHNVSDLSLPSRCVTPNVYQFVNKEDEDKKPSTYNGNNIDLGERADDE
ncbi:hypothetical protein HG535_0C04800 [Zygotorulaspora mrakii]|uniref:UBX domain-containing protein n=1 Tax=Zygotorulaspora mrakii TaxID=42260 RepID=A0A7H9B134_ZYGMR|nr:uncharacterized protein HG535_0C04800 [Zygotorulaspora mrakii]QLG72126.1 hypothetical protein HG535_0C04800 [Zygotorulaspora mrakii]